MSVSGISVSPFDSYITACTCTKNYDMLVLPQRRRCTLEHLFYYDTVIGRIGIAEENGAITNILFGEAELPGAMIKETGTTVKAMLQLEEYFNGRREVFELPVSVKGTPFQESVWKALKTIPYGETRSYKDIAVQIGKSKACRAVGMANNKNPVPILIPCHRVIGSGGRLVGYGGGLDIKRKLLAIEGIMIDN